MSYKASDAARADQLREYAKRIGDVLAFIDDYSHDGGALVAKLDSIQGELRREANVVDAEFEKLVVATYDAYQSANPGASTYSFDRQVKPIKDGWRAAVRFVLAETAPAVTKHRGGGGEFAVVGEDFEPDDGEPDPRDWE